MNIAITALVLFGVFAVLLLLGCPISISIAISSIATTLVNLPWDQTSFIVMQKMNSGVESFSLLAVPLFILAGNIMNNGGIARRLIRFAQLLSGRIPGSLAHTNVLANMFFGALSGSAVAAASAIGGIMAPMEEEEGYDPAFSTCVNIASAPTGLLIPPTSAFIVYSTVAGGVSVSALFMAGYIPGILMGLSTMAIAYCYAKKHNYPVCQKVTASEAVRITLDAIPSLLLIVIVIGGIVGGIFTATEGAGICVLYCLIPDQEELYENPAQQRGNQRHHPVPDIRILGNVMGDGLYRYPGGHQQCNHVHFHQQVRDPASDEPGASGGGHVPGYHTGLPDFHAYFPSHCPEPGHGSGPVRRGADIQYVYGYHDASGRLGAVCFLRYQQGAH